MDQGNIPRGSVINEDEKDSNPVLKVVYNKIRNLSKKLSQIEHIESLNRKTLKQAQINKLNSKAEVLKEIS